jgi:hypothetical protein
VTPPRPGRLLAWRGGTGSVRLRPSPGRPERTDDPLERRIRTVTRLPRHLLLLAALPLLLLAFSGSAFAAGPLQVIKDCNQDGQLNRKYSNKELRKALDNLPSDIDEYSDCRDVIGGAITGGSDKGGNRGTGGSGADGGGGGGSGAGGTGGNAAPITPEEQAARTQDQADLQALGTPESRENSPPIDVGGEQVKPGSNGLFDLASASNSLPTPLLIALIALALLAIAGGVVALRGRLPALARIPLLSKIPTPRVSLPRFRR